MVASAIKRLQTELDNGVTRFNTDLPVTEVIYCRAVREQLHAEKLKYEETKYRYSSDFTIHVRSKEEAEACVRFFDNHDRLRTHEFVADVIAERAELVKKNKLRKLTFRKPLPVPYEGLTEEQLLRKALTRACLK